ncbi:aminoacyl-tRNA hydrolase [Nitrosomonas mobilis]|uniref:Peptidyl-tRNA hydrolase n=1 Tax=Nitrosomonas mobilis TaxID=51642 RepID=A0A1G5SKQ5_9PROT|nr:aminoacyl-tRNA hydrolase [Nitrosomonas mobilis]SCZ87121.1 peptidyl-tRNA hydrolase [Nitrosomonas mobilis]HNO74704.1 aminoacyl-tRNA hydrolase [Nitrosomonas mobilis]
MPESPVKLIVGLGNPGEKYMGTRHNAGFNWLDGLAEKLRVTFRFEHKFHGLCAHFQNEGMNCWLLKPQTYMNASGISVATICHYYAISPEQMLVVHDELDLLPGSIKLKWGGGAGGHNGLKNILAHLDNQPFWRLRIGIGHPGNRQAVVNYVLHIPGKEESVLIDHAIEQSMRVWPQIIGGRLSEAMLLLHTKK